MKVDNLVNKMKTEKFCFGKVKDVNTYEETIFVIDQTNYNRRDFKEGTFNISRLTKIYIELLNRRK